MCDPLERQLSRLSYEGSGSHKSFRLPYGKTVDTDAKLSQIKQFEPHQIDSGPPLRCGEQYIEFFRVRRTRVLERYGAEDLDGDNLI
jgi:hypothetical protein